MIQHVHNKHGQCFEVEIHLYYKHLTKMFFIHAHPPPPTCSYNPCSFISRNSALHKNSSGAHTHNKEANDFHVFNFVCFKIANLQF